MKVCRNYFWHFYLTDFDDDRTPDYFESHYSNIEQNTDIDGDGIVGYWDGDRDGDSVNGVWGNNTLQYTVGEEI